jgi:hypothetical protein
MWRARTLGVLPRRLATVGAACGTVTAAAGCLYTLAYVFPDGSQLRGALQAMAYLGLAGYLAVPPWWIWLGAATRSSDGNHS